MYVEELKHYKGPDPWANSFWEQSEEHAIGFILALNPAGEVLADRVFPDLRNRLIQNLAIKRFPAFDSSWQRFRQSGWLVGLKLTDKLVTSLH